MRWRLGDLTRSSLATAGICLSVGGGSAHAQDRAGVQEVRLEPGQRMQLLTIAGLADSSADAPDLLWRSLDSSVVVVDPDGVLEARDWGSALVVVELGTRAPDSVMVRVAPTGTYEFSGVLSGNRRSRSRHLSRSVSGTVQFQELPGGTLAVSECGRDDVFSYEESSFSISCGQMSASLSLTEGGEISGTGSMSVTYTEPLREVCVRYDETGNCTRTGRRGGRVSAGLRGPITAHRREP